MALCASVERERPEELDNRVESFLLAGSTSQRLVAANAQNRGESRAICADNIVVHIPGLDAQCLALIHRRPGLWCLERGDVEQTLVNNREGIAHRFAISLAHLNRKLLLWTNLRRGIDYRVQNRFAVDNRSALHTIHSDWQVVDCLRVGLHERGVNIEVGCHIAGNQYSMCGLRICRGSHPLTRYHSRTIFYR